MLNRTLQVKLIKSNKEEPSKPNQIDHTYEGKVAILGAVLDRVVKKVGWIAIAYVGVDTFRQVLVAKANKS